MGFGEGVLTPGCSPSAAVSGTSEVRPKPVTNDANAVDASAKHASVTRSYVKKPQPKLDCSVSGAGCIVVWYIFKTLQLFCFVANRLKRRLK